MHSHPVECLSLSPASIWSPSAHKAYLKQEKLLFQTTLQIGIMGSIQFNVSELVKAQRNPLKVLPVADFTYILCTAFSYKSFSLHFRFILFWGKNIDVKAALKMLVKLTTWFLPSCSYDAVVVLEIPSQGSYFITILYFFVQRKQWQE